MPIVHAGRAARGRSAVSVAAVAFASAIVSQATSAHHSFDSLLTPDGEEVIGVVEGSVRVFRVLNPHGALIVDVPNGVGEADGWLMELSPATQLAREGWVDEMLSPGDHVSVSYFAARVGNRGRLRALLIHGRRAGEPAELYVSYGIRGDTPVMRRLHERLPVCGTIDASFQRTECFVIDGEAMAALEAEFPGEMGYVVP
ncbi:MAG TPA: DUF6152 family protein [Gammaproteobacteria bacterium]